MTTDDPLIAPLIRYASAPLLPLMTTDDPLIAPLIRYASAPLLGAELHLALSPPRQAARRLGLLLHARTRGCEVHRDDSASVGARDSVAVWSGRQRALDAARPSPPQRGEGRRRRGRGGGGPVGARPIRVRCASASAAFYSAHDGGAVGRMAHWRGACDRRRAAGTFDKARRRRWRPQQRASGAEQS